jgi:HEAT repeat protein
MRTLLPALSIALVVLAPSSAFAAPELTVGGGGGLGALGVRVDLAKPSLYVRTCAAAPCSATPDAADLQSVEIPVASADLPKDADVVLEKLPLGNGRTVVRVTVPIAAKNVAWEAIVAGQKPSAVVWSGMTGLSKGETGDRTGEALVVEDREGGGKFVLLGDLREDAAICSLPTTLLSPRALDPATLTWRGVTYQRLPKQQRAAAKRIVASPRASAADPSLAPILNATAASTGLARALTDNDSSTVWTEGRPGIGQGEFVAMRAPPEVPITRLAVTVAPQSPSPNGAAPRSFYLVTNKETFHVTLPEDAWQHPGDAYDIALPEPITTSCLSLVLDEAYDRGRPKPDVSIAELRAYSSFDGPNATLESVATSLAGGGARALAAAGVLKRAGKAGVGPLAAAYGSLDVDGRALAMDVAASVEDCAGANVLVRGLAEKDARIGAKARGKLERCGRQAAPALVDALRGPDLALRARVAPLLASAAPSLALEPLAAALDRGTPEVRSTLRGAFARAAESAPVDKLAEILMDAGRPNDARIDVLRASVGRLGDVRAEASGAIAALLVPGATMRTRYLLVGPLAALARAGDEPAEQRYLALLTRDPEWPVRAHAAELGEGIAPSALLAALKDPEPRVREAALKGLGAGKSAAATAPAAELLARDPWPFVRVAAAGLLANMPAHPGVDQVLASSIGDRSARVRRAIVGALEARRAKAHEKAIQARLDDPLEDLEVRVAAARALGSVCGRGATERLTKLASAAATPMLDDTEVQLAVASIESLGRLHPPDLAVRLQKLQDPGVRPEIRRVADAALKETETCP